jgi:hypothetical protein
MAGFNLITEVKSHPVRLRMEFLRGTGIRRLAQTSATIGSIKGVVTFYGASLAAAACVVGCTAAATTAGEVYLAAQSGANTLMLQVAAYLESQGISATAATTMALKLMSGVGAGKTGPFTVIIRAPAEIRAWHQTLNEMVREYRQSQGAH